ncbi:MAG: hypothetical protein FWE22_08120 [Firmicutes bacterium]|nr:hypothetical protein [Bacillota bacterium]
MKKLTKISLLIIVAMLVFVSCGPSEPPPLRFTERLPFVATGTIADVYERKTYSVRMYERIAASQGFYDERGVFIAAGTLVNDRERPVASGTMVQTIEYYPDRVGQLPWFRLTMEQIVTFERDFSINGYLNAMGSTDRVFSEIIFASNGHPIRSKREFTQGWQGVGERPQARVNAQGLPMRNAAGYLMPNFSYRTVAFYDMPNERTRSYVYRWRDVVEEGGQVIVSDEFNERLEVPISGALGVFDNEQMFLLARSMTAFVDRTGHIIAMNDLLDMSMRIDRRGRVSPIDVGIAVSTEKSPFVFTEQNQNLGLLNLTQDRVYGNANAVYAYTVRFSRQGNEPGQPIDIRISEPFREVRNYETGETTRTGVRFGHGASQTDRLILQKTMNIFDILPQHRRETAQVVHTLIGYTTSRE